MTWRELVERLKSFYVTQETPEEYARMSKAEQGKAKDHGGFVGGHLRGGIRRKGCVLSRSIITLDLDNATDADGIYDKIQHALADMRYVVYSTHSHTQKNIRLRIVIPIDTDISADEYEFISREVASKIGMQYFDRSTFQPERLMYWPTCSRGARIVRYEHDGKDLRTADYLDDGWEDMTRWQRHPDEQKLAPRKKPDDMTPSSEKPSYIGAFCRHYSVEQAIDNFIPETYTRVCTGRYTYTGGHSVGGAVVIGDCLFSHHATDPAGGYARNAFDLVRIHRFGHLDTGSGYLPTNAPSYLAMVELCKTIPEVANDVREVIVSRISDTLDTDFGDDDKAAGGFDGVQAGNNTNDASTQQEADGTQAKAVSGSDTAPQSGRKQAILDDIMAAIPKEFLTKSGLPKSSRVCTQIIIERLPYIADNLRYDELNDKIAIRRIMPWDKGKPRTAMQWSDADEAALRCDMEHFGQTGKEQINDAITRYAYERRYHPVRDYLLTLPPWDGVQRIDTLLIKNLGAEDAGYVREVTRLHLTAAVARIMSPGCKYDYVLMLQGEQGIGKSRIISALGGAWANEVSMLDNSKTAMENLRGIWLAEIGEMQGYDTRTLDAAKSFISRQSDHYRAAYERKATDRPRMLVFWSTTNKDTPLVGTEGNRRFIPILCTRKMTTGMVDALIAVRQQIWAEALHYYRALPKDIDGKPMLTMNDDTYAEILARQASSNVYSEDECYQCALEIISQWRASNDGQPRTVEDVHREIARRMDNFGRDWVQHWGRKQQMLVSKAFKDLGFTKNRKTINYKRDYVYTYIDTDF